MKRILALTLTLALLTGITVAQKMKEIDRHIPVKPAQRIEVREFSGSKIDFRSWDKNEVYVKVKIVFESSDREYEEEYINGVDLVLNETEKGMVVRLKQPTLRGRSGFSWENLFKLRFTSYVSLEITGEVYVPQSNALTLEAKYSTASLEDMKGELALQGTSSTIRLKNCSNIQRVENNYGTTTIEQSGGNLQLESKSSKITIDTFNGPVDLEADYSTVKLSDIKNEAAIQSRSATITADRIGGNLRIQADYSKMTVKDVKGFVDIRNQSGSINARSIEGFQADAPYTRIEVYAISGKSGKPIRIKGQSGHVEIENAVGDLFIDSPYSTIDLKTIRGNVEITNKSGKIRADDVVGNFTAKTEYTLFDIGDITANTIYVTNKSNGVSFDLKNTPAKIEIHNEYGDVSVKMPAGYSGDVRLKVGYGKIMTNLPVKIEDLGGGAYVIDKVGEKKNLIDLQTKSANIRLYAR